MTALKLPEPLIQAFLRHAENTYPEESCGLLTGAMDDIGANAQEYIAIENTQGGNRERRFLIDPLGWQETEDRADALGQSIIAIVHSHPDHPDLASEFDRQQAWPNLSYIIISVQKGEVASFRSWRLSEDRSHFTEESIESIPGGLP